MAKRQAKTKSKRTARGGGATVILLNPGARITLPSGETIYAPPSSGVALPAPGPIGLPGPIALPNP